jgi:hypothetical protein
MGHLPCSWPSCRDRGFGRHDPSATTGRLREHETVASPATETPTSKRKPRNSKALRVIVRLRASNGGRHEERPPRQEKRPEADRQKTPAPIGRVVKWVTGARSAGYRTNRGALRSRRLHSRSATIPGRLVGRHRRLAQFFKAMGHPTRFGIILRRQPRRPFTLCNELVKQLASCVRHIYTPFLISRSPEPLAQSPLNAS